jgi:hypothetical protein
VGRLKALGNGQVPVVAATAWKLLEQALRNTVTSESMVARDLFG